MMTEMTLMGELSL